MSKFLIIPAAIFASALLTFSVAHGLSIFTTFQGGTGTSSPQGILYGSGSANPLKTVIIGSNLTFSAGTLSSTDTSFSTTSANYWSTFGLGFSTTSTNFWLTGKSTTNLAEGSNLYYTAARDIQFSTTSASYFSSFGLAHSTTSVAYQLSQNIVVGNSTSTTIFATTASTTNLFGTSLIGFGLTSCSGTSFLQWTGGIFGCGTPAGSSGFSTTSASYFSSVGLAFSTTSSDYWVSTKGYLTSAVTSVTATAPLFSSGGNTPNLTWYGLSTTTQPSAWNVLVSNGSNGVYGVATSSFFVNASAGVTGLLSGTDWNTFNNKGSGSVTSVATNNGLTGGTITTTGTIGLASIAAGSVLGTTITGVPTAQATSTLFNTASASVSGLMASVDWKLLHTATTTFSAPLTWTASTNAVTCATCSTAAAANPTASLGLAAVNGSATSFMRSDGAPALSQSITPTWTGLHIFNTGGLISNASSTFLGGVFPALNRFGLGSTSPSVLWGGVIGTSTVVGNAQFNILIASSTSNAANITVNWDTGNSFRHILTTNTTVAINSTSSNPRDGGKYILFLCQDNTGSRTVTFTTPGQLVWLTAEGTTTIKSTANTMTAIGMTYDARVSRYLVMATSTTADTRACQP